MQIAQITNIPSSSVVARRAGHRVFGALMFCAGYLVTITFPA